MRRNALKHGLTGRGVVMLPEDERARNVRLAAWNRDLSPDGATQRQIVEMAVTASIQHDRARRHEDAAAQNRVRHASAEYDSRLDADTERRLAEFHGDPTPFSARRLRRTSEGCTLLVELLLDAIERLTSGRPLTPERVDRVCACIPREVNPYGPDLLRELIEKFAPGAEAGASPEPGGESAGTPAVQGSHDARDETLRAVAWVLGSAANAFNAQAYELADAEQVDREQAGDRALVDTGSEGVTMRRYQTSAELGVTRSLAALVKARAELSMHKEIGFFRPNPTCTMQRGVYWTGTHWSATPDDWDGDPATLITPPRPATVPTAKDHPAHSRERAFLGAIPNVPGEPVYRDDWLEDSPELPRVREKAEYKAGWKRAEEPAWTPPPGWKPFVPGQSSEAPAARPPAPQSNEAASRPAEAAIGHAPTPPAPGSMPGAAARGDEAVVGASDAGGRAEAARADLAGGRREPGGPRVDGQEAPDRARLGSHPVDNAPGDAGTEFLGKGRDGRRGADGPKIAGAVADNGREGGGGRRDEAARVGDGDGAAGGGPAGGRRRPPAGAGAGPPVA